MNVRPSVETWNRGELEDKFYRQYDQLIALKKKNNDLEKRLRLSSSRIRQVLQTGESAENDERIRDLERENRLLAQKLKALRHQLINYTRPQAHNTTLNFLTSRSTARPPSPHTDQSRKLQNLRSEYDKLLSKFEETRKRLDEIGDPESGYPSDNGTAAIVEKELIILREENRVLKAANDRFVSNSLTQEEGTKSTTKELQALQKNIQETEIKLAEVTAENRQIGKRIKEIEAEKRYLESKYKKLKEKVAVKDSQRGKPVGEIVEAPPSPIAESLLPKVELKREKRRRSKASESSVLDRLFEDVASIVESHISRTDSSLSLDHEPATNAKWRQLYEEVYSELEKVRNLLFIQHRINERQKKEISILNEYNDHNKQEYEKKLADFVMELNRRAKRIEILENQLRSIASGATDFDHSVLTEVSQNLKKIELTSVSTTEMTLRMTKLRITEAGLKAIGSPEPTVFISLEFFDFELQTTPLIQGPEAVFDYSTVYEVIVSNLFIHYIEKEGVNIEVFDVRGINYEQIGSGVISLKKLLETETPARITGQLKIVPVAGETQTTLGILEYSLEVPFNLIKALKAQKRRLTASTYLPVGDEDKSLYNELVIQIHRCSNLDSLRPNSKIPSTFAVYQIYDLPPHLTAVVNKNINPIFDNTRSFSLPKGSALHKYLKTEELVVHVVEESKSTPGVQKELGSVKLPLFVLARNQKLQGSFPLTAEDGSLSKATIDVSLHWKYAYTFNDENLEVEAPIPVNSSEMEEFRDLEKLKKELEKINKEETESDDFEEDREKTPTPPLKLPPIPPPRRLSKTKAVDFKEPLHSSIPPSEESSFAGSVEGTPRPRESTKTFQKSSPNISAPASAPAIRQASMETPVEGSHHSESDYSVIIRLGRLSVVEHSMLLSEEYDHVNVFIEWNFLDFANELCETPESVPIPRNTWKVETFECERVYELNSRRVALLKQWMETQNRLSFNLVSDPEEDDGCDDLGVAQLDLSDVINSSVHSIVFHDVNGEAIAVLDLTMLYSDELTKQLTGERN
ncbi:hypothetical protein FO519_009350 [Halicephalobus sp. NKZ332]|nr:hypothetical protein FO519_009350 [Halicephalobus sp. NKZ332]